MKTILRRKAFPLQHHSARYFPPHSRLAGWLAFTCSLFVWKSAVAASADLSVTATETPNPVIMGGTLTYTYVLTNKGPDTATGIIVSNTLPPTVIPGEVTITNGSYTLTNSLLLYYPVDLAAGASVTLQLKCTPVNLEALTNMVFVTATEPDPVTWDIGEAASIIQVVDVAIAGKLNVPRQAHTAVLLSDGKVLFVGGYSGIMSQPTSSAELYDPRTESFTITGDMGYSRVNHTATRLPDGTVLVSGGSNDSGPLAAVEIYDPTNGTFKVVSSLSVPRSGHTATLLSDGRVLIAGGTSATNGVDYYDYRAGTVSSSGELLATRSGHLASLLPDGKVLFAGGSSAAPRSAEIFDPQTGVSTATGSLLADHSSLAGVTLLSGKFLICGGTAAELYDPATGQFTLTGPPLVDRHIGRATLLKDGRVLVSGGNNQIEYLSSTELYTPATGQFIFGSPMSRPRLAHSSTLLQDGRVLLADGDSSEIAALGLDSDVDGMDDAWELQHGFSPTERADAVEDADKDGHTNLQEYLAGTDPLDPKSVMRITTCQLDAGTFRIDFTSVLGKLYRVQRKSDSQGGGWETVADNIVGTGGVVRVLDTNAGGSSNWLYRVKLVL